MFNRTPSMPAAQTSDSRPARRFCALLLPLAIALVGLGIATAAARWGYRQANERAVLAARLELEELRTESAKGQGGGLELKIAAQEEKIAALRADQAAFKYFSHWDAQRYEEIVDLGYVNRHGDGAGEVVSEGHVNGRLINVVWYPLYPLLGIVVKEITGAATNAALHGVSVACLLAGAAAFFLMARRHFQGRGLPCGNEAAVWATALLLMGPCSYFLYANFTEGLFVLLLASFLYCVQGRQWWMAAVIAGIASASRSQGVLLGPVLVVSFLAQTQMRPIGKRVGVAMLLGVISAAGLLAYMAYLQRTWGDGLAFMHAQALWNVGINRETVLTAMNPWNAVRNFIAALRLGSGDPPVDWPNVWQAACVIWPPVVLVLGRKWLSLELGMIGWLLWGLPYVSNSLAGYPAESMVWMSMGRFMAVALPVQMILGAAAARRRWLGVILLGVSGAAFGIFAVMAGGNWWLG